MSQSFSQSSEGFQPPTISQLDDDDDEWASTFSRARPNPVDALSTTSPTLTIQTIFSEPKSAERIMGFNAETKEFLVRWRDGLESWEPVEEVQDEPQLAELAVAYWRSLQTAMFPLMSKAPPEEKHPPKVNDDECYTCGDGGNLVCCDGCQRAFHAACLTQPPQDDPDQPWHCPHCTDPPQSPVARRTLAELPQVMLSHMEDDKTYDSSDVVRWSKEAGLQLLKSPTLAERHAISSRIRYANKGGEFAQHGIKMEMGVGNKRKFSKISE